MKRDTPSRFVLTYCVISTNKWLLPIGRGAIERIIGFEVTQNGSDKHELDANAAPQASLSCQHLLLNVYNARRAKNPSYSIRAFARSLGVSKTAIADTLSHKRNLSRKNILKIAEHIGLSPSEIEYYLQSHPRMRVLAKKEEEHILDEDSFHVIADWYHYGLLSLARLKSNQAKADWVAQRLGITPLEARTAMLRLQRLKMIQIENGKMRRIISKLNTSDDIVSSALRKHHRQNLHRAETALENIPPEEREFGSMTFLGDPHRLTQAKKLIRDFEDRLTRYLEGGEGTQVYQLCLQLFPTQKKGKKNA